MFWKNSGPQKHCSQRIVFISPWVSRSLRTLKTNITPTMETKGPMTFKKLMISSKTVSLAKSAAPKPGVSTKRYCFPWTIAGKTRWPMVPILYLVGEIKLTDSNMYRQAYRILWSPRSRGFDQLFPPGELSCQHRFLLPRR